MTSKGDKMHGQSHLLKRGSIYYFRARIPPDLRPHYGDKWELKISLRTSDKREASRLCRIRAATTAEDFERLRYQQSVAHGKTPKRLITEIDQALIEQINAR